MAITGVFSHCAESATGCARLDMCQHEFRRVRASRLWPIDSKLTPSDDDSPCLLSTNQRAVSSTILTTRVCWVLADGKREVRLPSSRPTRPETRADPWRRRARPSSPCSASEPGPLPAPLIVDRSWSSSACLTVILSPSLFPTSFLAPHPVALKDTPSSRASSRPLHPYLVRSDRSIPAGPTFLLPVSSKVGRRVVLR